MYICLLHDHSTSVYCRIKDFCNWILKRVGFKNTDKFIFLVKAIYSDIEGLIDTFRNIVQSLRLPKGAQ